MTGAAQTEKQTLWLAARTSRPAGAGLCGGDSVNRAKRGAGYGDKKSA